MPLADKLMQRIRDTGPIGVDQYMAACLSDPEFGYYMTRHPFGPAGDFVTAPEISQIFGEMIGFWCAGVWQQMGTPASFRLVEFGPGNGTLAADALRAIATLPGCYNAARVEFIEISPTLRKRQEQTLARHHPNKTAIWHANLASVADDLQTMFIANEFFDALPIRQWLRREDQWRERLVGIADGALNFIEGPIGAPPIALPVSDDNALLETAEAAWQVAADIGQRLAQTGGACLIIDYGHSTAANGDSLQAVREHGYASVLDACGAVDLSAHVDFTALASALARPGIAVHGPITQRHWLQAVGAAERGARLMQGKEPATVATISQGLRRLLDPMAMGSLFKVLAAASADLGPLPGFAA